MAAPTALLSTHTNVQFAQLRYTRVFRHLMGKIRNSANFVSTPGRRGWAITEEYGDQGVSGSQESRPALNRLITARLVRTPACDRVFGRYDGTGNIFVLLPPILLTSTLFALLVGM